MDFKELKAPSNDLLVLFGVRQGVGPIRLLEYLDQALFGCRRQRMRSALFFGSEQSSSDGAHFGRQILELCKIIIKKDKIKITTKQ